MAWAPPNFVDGGRPSVFEGIEKIVIDSALRITRRTHHDFRTTRHLGQTNGHQSRGCQRSRSTRHIEPHTTKRIIFSLHFGAMTVAPLPTAASRLSSKTLNIRVSLLDGSTGLGTHLTACMLQLLAETKRVWRDREAPSNWRVKSISALSPPFEPGP